MCVYLLTAHTKRFIRQILACVRLRKIKYIKHINEEMSRLLNSQAFMAEL